MVEVQSTFVPNRKHRLKKQKKRIEGPRFTADEIVRTIEAVQQAGLTVHSVEITLNGSVSIHTSADAMDEVQPNTKRA